MARAQRGSPTHSHSPCRSRATFSHHIARPEQERLKAFAAKLRSEKQSPSARSADIAHGRVGARFASPAPQESSPRVFSALALHSHPYSPHKASPSYDSAGLSLARDAETHGSTSSHARPAIVHAHSGHGGDVSSAVSALGTAHPAFAGLVAHVAQEEHAAVPQEYAHAHHHDGISFDASHAAEHLASHHFDANAEAHAHHHVGGAADPSSGAGSAAAAAAASALGSASAMQSRPAITVHSRPPQGRNGDDSLPSPPHSGTRLTAPHPSEAHLSLAVNAETHGVAHVRPDVVHAHTGHGGDVSSAVSALGTAHPAFAGSVAHVAQEEHAAVPQEYAHAHHHDGVSFDKSHAAEHLASHHFDANAEAHTHHHEQS